MYDDIDIPEPPTLFDTWEDNAVPARFQEMMVAEHLHLTYDLFVPPTEPIDEKSVKARDPSGWKNLQRVTEEQRAVFDPLKQQYDEERGDLREQQLGHLRLAEPGRQVQGGAAVRPGLRGLRYSTDLRTERSSPGRPEFRRIAR